MRTATSYVISKSLSKELLEKTIDNIIAPLYDYQGGKPSEKVAEISDGRRQAQERLFPKSLAFFENPNKIGYFQRNFLLRSQPFQNQARVMMKVLAMALRPILTVYMQQP